MQFSKRVATAVFPTTLPRRNNITLDSLGAGLYSWIWRLERLSAAFEEDWGQVDSLNRYKWRKLPSCPVSSSARRNQ